MFILENNAYGIPAVSTSTETIQGIEMSAKNAVDEDPDTYSLTKSETNPQLTVTLPDIFNIGHINISLTIGISHNPPNSVTTLTPPLSGNPCFKSIAIISHYCACQKSAIICQQFTTVKFNKVLKHLVYLI